MNSGVWYQQGELSYVKKPISPLVGIRLYAEKGLGSSNFAIKTGIDYNYLISSKTFKFDGTIGVWHSNENDFIRLNQIYGNGLHNFSIPLLLKYRKYKINPSIGINYNYLQSNSVSETDFAYTSSSHNVGLNPQKDKMVLGESFGLRNSQFRISLGYKLNNK